LTLMTIIVYRVFTEERKKKEIKAIFGKFVNPSIVEELLASPPELGGQDMELTVMFSDIRGFTPLSEKLAPQKLVSHLNEYLTAMTEIILEQDGTLDKYVGDEIMCFWGAPKPLNNHAELAKG
jgi:adenylate cyclase